MIFRAGQRVKVISTEYTDRRYGTNGSMLREVDTVQLIEAMDGSDCAKINGCYWDVKDLRPLMVEEKPQIFHYDEALLKG